MSITEQGSWDVPGTAASRRATTGATGPRPTSRASGRAAPATAPRRRTTPPSRACSARCCCPRTPSPTSVEALRGADFYRPVHEVIFDAIIDLYGRGEPADPITVGQRAPAPGRAGPHRRRPLPPHPLGQRPDRRQRRLLRRDRAREGDPAPAGRRRHQDRPDGLRRRRARSTTSSTRRRPRSTRSPTAVPPRTTRRSPTSCNGVLDEIDAIENREAGLYGVPTGFAELDELTNGLHTGQMIIVAARPAVGKSTLGARPVPRGVDPATTSPAASSAWR